MIAGLVAVILVNGLRLLLAAARSCELTLTVRRAGPGRGRDRARPSPTPDSPTISRAVGSSSRSATATSSAATSSGSTRTQITARAWPVDAVYVERREYGPLLGRPLRVRDGERTVAEGAPAVLGPPAGPRRGGGARIGASSSRSRRARSAPSTRDREAPAARAQADLRGHPGPAPRHRRRASGDRPARAAAEKRYRAEAAASSTACWRARASTARGLPGHRRDREGAACPRPLPRLRRQPARLLGRARIYVARLVEFPRRTTRASRTPRAASSRPSSAP